MKKNNDYYKQVEKEIREGKYEEGMRTRAIAEASGDENKARALYIKFRVRSLKREAANLMRKEKEEEEQERLAELNIQLENLSPVARRRKIIRIVGVSGGFGIGIVVGIILIVSLQVPTGIEDLLLEVLSFGGLGACLGYVSADVVRGFMPSQCRLSEIEKQKKYLKISPISRFINRVCIQFGFQIGTFLRRLLSFLFRD